MVQNPTNAQIRRTIKSLKSYGASSYASITDESGNYLQVAGGGVTCMLEQYRADTKERFRAFRCEPNKAFPDGTLLVFRTGRIPMKADEWFSAERVSEIFCAFSEGSEFPSDLGWRQSPGF